MLPRKSSGLLPADWAGACQMAAVAKIIAQPITDINCRMDSPACLIILPANPGFLGGPLGFQQLNKGAVFALGIWETTNGQRVEGTGASSGLCSWRQNGYQRAISKLAFPSSARQLSTP